ncbi:cytochrome P450 [Actinocrispum wychmicini]|uniref:Cytochrome P450 n=1 Tax=Actinocrispum wychmicini TaxID=1213861 RepID=A0A4R2JA36_9PSEU|nr:cytochrome P450 [Actinocrispum wychmicini]TCO53498.1 cytochrome P450 [Actinocrispum wychmicini]
MTTSYINGLPMDRQRPLDPPDEIAAVRTHDPISPMTYPDGHEGWLVTSQHAARAVLASPSFSNLVAKMHSPVERPGVRDMNFEIPPGMFNRMDPPDHTRIRRMLTGQFTVHRMHALEPRIAKIAEDRLDEIEAAGPPTDLVTSFALPIPSLVICELLGIPQEYRGTFQQDSATMLNLDTPPEDINSAYLALCQTLSSVVNGKRANPPDDILGGLIAEGQLTHEELVTIAMILLVAGHETTANMLALGTYTILQHPDQRAALLNDPAAAVEELLRYLSIIHLGPVRSALRDVEIEGHLVRAGQCVTISVPGANRDPEKFADPDTLDVTRDAHGHVAFGHGIHQCLGQQLARIEMRIGFTALLRRFPSLRLAGGVRFRTRMTIYGVHTLPVAWDK